MNHRDFIGSGVLASLAAAICFSAATFAPRGLRAAADEARLGIDLDETVAAKFPYEEKAWSTPRLPDSSYVDR